MVVRLNPQLPLVWRTPSSVQVGLDPPVVVLDDVSTGEERLLATLVAGVSESGYAMVADTVGVAPGDAWDLVRLLAPALERADPAPAGSRVAVLGGSDVARHIAGLLDAEAALADPAEADLVVLVADWVLSPADSGPWLNRDVPHLPVIVTDQAITVGPLVEPGAGPCLHCVHLARVDEDAAWPAIATQLMERPGRGVSRLEAAAAAVFTLRAIAAWAPRSGEAISWRLTSTGAVSERRWTRHPECRCSTPPGSDWVAAPGSPAAPTTVRAVAGRA